MKFVKTPSSALGVGFVLAAALLAPLGASADDPKPQAERAPSERKEGTSERAKPANTPRVNANKAGPARDTAERAPDKAPAQQKRGRAQRDPARTQGSDADIAARKPPPPSQALDPKRAQFSPVKTEETGAGQAHDESKKVLAPAPPATGSASTQTAFKDPENESDEKLRERVQAALLADRKLPYTARMVKVQVKDGTITLSGEVNTDYERTRVRQSVERIRGRHEMLNHITVRNRAPEAVQATSR